LESLGRYSSPDKDKEQSWQKMVRDRQLFRRKDRKFTQKQVYSPYRETKENEQI